MIKNAFFDIALKAASRLIGKKKRMLMLLGKLGLKLKEVRWSEVRRRDIKDKFAIIARLFKAYVLGHYRSIPWKPLLLITGAVIYFIMPLDLIPDILPGVGLTDDFGIIVAIYQSLSNEVEKFLTWEKSQLSPP